MRLWIQFFRVRAAMQCTARTQIAARSARSALAPRAAVARLAIPAAGNPSVLRSVRAYSSHGEVHTPSTPPPPPPQYEQPKPKGRFRRVLGNVVKLGAVVFIGATAFFLYGE